MNFEDAIKERIRKYYDPNYDEEGIQSNQLTPPKYDRKYFDNFEAKILEGRNKDKK